MGYAKKKKMGNQELNQMDFSKEAFKI